VVVNHLTLEDYLRFVCNYCLILMICDTGGQNPSLVVFGFFTQSYSTLHLLQNTFYRIKISCFYEVICLKQS